MADKKSSPAKQPAKAKRTLRTPEQRIAQLEADLVAARAKAEVRANKGRVVLETKREALVKRIQALSVKVEDIDVQLRNLPSSEA